MKYKKTDNKACLKFKSGKQINFSKKETKEFEDRLEFWMELNHYLKIGEL